MKTTSTAAQIATRNDAFRRNGLRFLITRGVQGLTDVLGLIAAVRGFTDFTDDSDPYHEHDFGSLTWSGETVYWKIDYYDQQCEAWQSPLSPDCHRVLTILLAEEYKILSHVVPRPGHDVKRLRQAIREWSDQAKSRRRACSVRS